MSATAVLTIYPTALKVAAVLRARARGGNVSLGHRLTTFPELVDALDREIGGATPVVGEALATLAMHDALAEVVGDASVDERPGLASAARRAIGELAAACIGTAELAALAPRMADAPARRTVGWLAAVAAAYAQRLARLGGVDRHERDRRVLTSLHAHEAAGTRPRIIAGIGRIVIAEIYDYSALQSLIVRALIRLVGDAELVTLAHAENVDATRFLERTWNRFVEDPAIADKVLPDFVVRGGRRGTLARVLGALFVEPKPPAGADSRDGADGRDGVDAKDGSDARHGAARGTEAVRGDDSLRIVAASSRVAEVEEVGRRLRTTLAAGADPERVAILARDLAPYRAILEDVARRYRLPFALAAPRPLVAHATVQTVLRVVHAVVDGLPRAALVAALGSPYLTAAPRGARRVLEASGYVDAATLPLGRCLAHAEARLERARLRRATAGDGDAHGDTPRSEVGPSSGRDGRLDPHTSGDAGQSGADEREARALARLRRDGPRIAAAVRRLGTLDATRTIAEHAAALLRVLDDLGVDVPDEIADGEAWSEGAALTTLQRMLSEVADAGAELGTERVPLARFLARLGEAIDASEVRAPGPIASGVAVLPIADARGLDFDDVFVLGLEEGGFPAAVAEDGLVNDAVRRALNRAAPPLVRAALGDGARHASLGRLLRTSEDRAAEDPFLFYLALSTAEERIVLTHATHDGDGNALVRSPFVDEVVAITGQQGVAAAPWKLGADFPQQAGAAVASDAEDIADTDGAGMDGAADTDGTANPAELLHAAVVRAERDPGLLAAVAPRLPAGSAARLVHRIGVERRRARYFLLDRDRDAAAKEALADAFVGRLGADPRRRERLRSMPWSATKFEELGACGFKFFAHRILNLRADDAGAEMLDVREEGVLAHRLLELVFRRCDPLPSDPEDAAAAARTIAEEARAAMLADMRPADPALVAPAWLRAVEAVVEVVGDESCEMSRPARRLLEWPFRLEIADHRSGDGLPLDLTISGAIDRADLWLDDTGMVVAARVLDYKNTKRDSEHRAKLDAERAMGSTSFQIPVYALALTASPMLAWAPDAKVRGGYVLVRAERKLRDRAIDPAFLVRDPETRRTMAAEGAAAPIASRVITLVERAVDGRFDVDPSDCSRLCEYRHICRYEPPPEEDA